LEKGKGKLNQYLITFKSKYKNLWEKGGFNIVSCEAFVATDKYSVLDVDLIFQNNTVYIHFFKKDILLGCFIVVNIISEG